MLKVRSRKIFVTWKTRTGSARTSSRPKRISFPRSQEAFLLAKTPIKQEKSDAKPAATLKKQVVRLGVEVSRRKAGVF